MAIKTESYYNNNDFVEENGQMKELTVTITLQEYRMLLEERYRHEVEEERLLREIEKYKKQLEAAEMLRG